MDIRVPMGPIERAFGVDSTVTRPWAVPIATKVIWGEPRDEEGEFGTEYQVRGARWTMSIRQDQVPELQRGSLVLAPGPGFSYGTQVRSWLVEGIERGDRDYWIAIVTPEPVSV